MAQRRVLIAHPSDRVSQTLAGALTRTQGLSAMVVHDGFDTAVELLSGDVDSLVLHTGTPGLSPGNVIRFLRDRNATKQLPIWLLLAKSTSTIMRAWSIFRWEHVIKN